ncbi:hypothetical protein ACH518_00835 (plasmid) [Methylomonas sp. HW2-6]|uniref:hypothetical protein n=1 Tax=Methylomonas sp. HW2-6 TaxID=3376687 RepID=UPI00404290B7
MTSNSTFPQRLTEIDDLTRPDHYYLTADDTCYFLGEYTAREGYAFSATNSLIINFKKSVDKRGTTQWRYKDLAIQQSAIALRNSINPEALNNVTLVPIPPSKAKDDPLYDDRLLRMLKLIRPLPPLDIRELIVQNTSTLAAHDSDSRPRPEDLENLYEIDQSLVTPQPQLIAVFDDVLTTGSHFKAAQSLIQKTFPGVRIIGVFIARRARGTMDFNDIFGNIE